jgi:hypothetical protein
MLREKLEADARVRAAYDGGTLPAIHVSVEALMGSGRPEREYETVSGD